MKFLIKLLLSLVVISIAILFIVCYFFAPKIIPRVMEDYVDQHTSFTLEIKDFSVNPLLGSAALKNVSITNPSFYPDPRLLTAPKFTARVSLPSLMTDRIVFDRAVVDISDLTWVQTKDLRINLAQFAKEVKAATQAEAAQSPEAKNIPEGPKLPKIQKTYLIKHLTVNLGKLNFVGFSKDPSKVTSYNVNYTKDFYDVTDVEQLSKQIGKDLQQYGITFLVQGLFERLPRDLEPSTVNKIIDVSGDVADEIKTGAKKVGREIKNLFK